MKTTLLRSAFLSLAVLVLFVSSQAQSNSQLAQLSGTLTDSSGAGVDGAQVQARAEGSPNSQSPNSLTWSAKSSPNGEYILDLPPGRYRVQFTRPSFARREAIVNLTPGESHTLNLRLDLEPLSSSVVVTANAQPLELDRTPAPVDLISHQEIDQRQAVSLPDLLATQTGISLARTGTIGGLATIFIDGGNSNFTKVLIDGTPVNEPGGVINFSNLALDNVDKVEIVHGAESALYGTDAMSGVVQVMSHRGTTRVPELNLFAEGGSFSSARGGAQLSGLLGAFDYSAAGSYFQTDGQGVDDKFLNRSLAGNFGYRFSDSNQLRFTVRSNASFAGTPGQTLFASTPFAVDPTAYDKLKQLSSNLTWSFRTGSHWTHQISGMESRILDTFGDSGFFPTDQFNRSGLLEQSTFSFRQGAVTAGYQYEVENAYPSSLGGTHARRNNQAGFLDARWQPVSRLILSAGARAEANTNFGTRTVPRAGIVYALHDSQGFWGDTRARFSYGQGVEEPNLFVSFSTDPCDPGNPTLKPEQSKTWNAGLDQKLANDHAKISAGYFASRFYDLISFTSCFPGSPCQVPQPPLCTTSWGRYFNTDLARARGVNVAGEMHLLHWLSLMGNYSHDDSRVLVSPNAFDTTETPGNHLLRRPVNSGNMWLNANYRRINFNIAGYFSGRRTDSDFLGLGLTRNPGYARFDVATSYNFIGGLSFYGRVANLFDKPYQEALGYPALGRDVRVGMSYRFSGRN